MVIAIDGPAGAGKSTVARSVAARLGFTYLDTGAMYRCVGLAANRAGRPAADVVDGLDIEVGDTVLLNGEDVTQAIRQPGVSDAASQAAADPAVRRALVAMQQRIIEHGNWVAEGRDVGAGVAPHAEVKVFLYADPQERARRRATPIGARRQGVLQKQNTRDPRGSSAGRASL